MSAEDLKLKMLKDYVYDVDMSYILDIEEDRIIYVDVDIEEIASILENVTLDDLEKQFSFYGTWEIVKCENSYYLIGE